jgi:hypothetical protein
LKKRRLDRNVGKRLNDGRSGTIIAGVLVFVGLCVLFFFVYDRRASNPDYEGTIVDRWADYAESEQGSTPRFRLLVESQDHKRFAVKVDPNVYESARVGMRIKSRSGQIVLIDSEQRTTVGK